MLCFVIMGLPGQLIFFTIVVTGTDSCEKKEEKNLYHINP